MVPVTVWAVDASVTALPALRDQRVLVLHHRYRLAGGEERFVDLLAATLQRHGAHVHRAERASDGVGSLAAARGLLAGGIDPEQVAAVVRREGITVVHAHNVHPTFGWRALRAARDAGAAVVLHLHNYRLFCAVGIVYRDGRDCVACAPRATRHGLRHNCRGSLAESAVYAAGLARSQQPLLAAADVVAVPHALLGRDLVALGFDGLDPQQLPTPVDDGAVVDGSTADRGGYGLFVGRMTEEKGVLWAVRAAAAAGVSLRMAGDGPALQAARTLAAELGADVQCLGAVDREQLAGLRAGAAFAVVPSLWREVLPLAALEAIAAGLPLITSDRGALPGLTEPELVVPADDLTALADLMAALMAEPERRSVLGAQALERAGTEFSEQAFVRRLAAIYALAVARLGSPG